MAKDRCSFGCCLHQCYQELTVIGLFFSGCLNTDQTSEETFDTLQSTQQEVRCIICAYLCACMRVSPQTHA